MRTCIEATGLTKDFDGGQTRAVDDVTFHVEEGEIVALLGPNGAGKSTAIDMILGLAVPTAGSVRLFDTSPRQAILDGDVAAVLQSGGLLRDLTVAETVDLVASTYAAAPASEVISRANLDRIVDSPVGKCSGGEQQRLRFALALLARPRLMLLDEPTAGMDVEGRHDFWDAMATEAEGGTTIMFATHYLAEVEQFSPRTIVLNHGQIVADGPTEIIRNRTADRTVSARFESGAILEAAAMLRTLETVHETTIEGDTLVVGAVDSDEVARLILGPLGGSEVTIGVASLETAFRRLTTDTGTTTATEPTPDRASESGELRTL